MGIAMAYNGTLTAEQFLFYEMRIVSKQYLEQKPIDDIIACIQRDNLFQYPTERRADLARRWYEATSKSRVHTRLVGLARETNKELLIKHMRASGDKGAPLKELQQVLPGHSHNQLQVLMRELRKEDRIYCEEKTNAARWFLLDSSSESDRQMIANNCDLIATELRLTKHATRNQKYKNNHPFCFRVRKNVYKGSF